MTFIFYIPTSWNQHNSLPESLQWGRRLHCVSQCEVYLDSTGTIWDQTSITDSVLYWICLLNSGSQLSLYINCHTRLILAFETKIHTQDNIETKWFCSVFIKFPQPVGGLYWKVAHPSSHNLPSPLFQHLDHDRLVPAAEQLLRSFQAILHHFCTKAPPLAGGQVLTLLPDPQQDQHTSCGLRDWAGVWAVVPMCFKTINILPVLKESSPSWTPTLMKYFQISPKHYVCLTHQIKWL